MMRSSNVCLCSPLGNSERPRGASLSRSAKRYFVCLVATKAKPRRTRSVRLRLKPSPSLSPIVAELITELLLENALLGFDLNFGNNPNEQNRREHC